MKYNFDEVIDRTNTNCVKYDLRRRFFGTDDVIPMWVADMDFRTPPFIINALRKRLDHEILGYTFRMDSFSKAVIQWLQKRHKWQIKPEWINFSPGVVPGLSMAVLTFTNPGDKIIVQPPVYFPFFSVVEGNGRQLVYNRLKLDNGRYFIDFEDLNKKIDTGVKMLILSNPQNPGGTVWSRDELNQFGEICVKNDVLILSDEIHCDLVFSPNRFTPLASISDDIAKQVITFMAPSKTFNLAGLATSFVLITDEKKMKAYNKTLDTMHLFIGNLFGMLALESAYNGGDDWLNQLLHYLKGNLDYLSRYVEKNIPQVKVISPEATYMAWIDFRELGMKDKELKRFLVTKAKVGMNDGTAFGPGGSGFMRMNFACPHVVLKEALDRIKKAIHHQ